MNQEDKLHSESQTAMNEFVYEDELLPEIDIREMISLEQMIQYNPSFVALSFNDIVFSIAYNLIHLRDICLYCIQNRFALPC
jgi:hypothetical protein